MKKVLKIAGIVVLILVLLAVALAVKLLLDLRKQAERQAIDQANMVKTDEELLGQHLYIPREGKEPVDVNLYLPESGSGLPVVFNLHGGAFIAGDADTLDTQSQRISGDWNAVVVTVNYTLAKDGVSIEYGTEEVADTIRYFLENAADYRIDPEKAVVLGYSAGGNHAMMAALALQREGIRLAGQVLCYSFTGEAVSIYGALTEEQRKTASPALFILADGDPISDGSLAYEEALREQGVATQVKKYDGAIHGFIEENNPEYEELFSKQSKSPEQEVLARDAERYIGQWLAEVLAP